MTSLQPVRAARLYEGIVEQIEAAIAEGRLRPGQHLPSERELVVQTGASRATVREALRVLESQGVVRSRHGDRRGPEVLPFDSAALSKQMTRLARAEQIDLAELIGYRMVLDASATLLAARLRTEDQLAEMDLTLARMSAAIDEGGEADGGDEAFGRADVAFHDAVAAASGNRLIRISNAVVRAEVLRLIADSIGRLRDPRELMRRSLAHHTEVLAAIRAGEAGAAAHAARRTLYEYYAGFVPVEQRGALWALVDDDGPAPDVGAS